MFVPVIAYDPDLFADYVFVLSQLEISTASQPSKPPTNEKATYVPQERVTDVLSQTIPVYRWSQIKNQQITSVDQTVLVAALATQIQSKFTARTFNSSITPGRIDVPLATGAFVTDQTIEPLFDNIVLRVTVGALDLSDTKANNKSVAPVVS